MGTAIDNVRFDEWDRNCFYISSALAEPFVQIAAQVTRLISRILPGEYDQCATTLSELFHRLKIVVIPSALLGGLLFYGVPLKAFAIAPTVLFVASRIFRKMGMALQKDEFTLTRTGAAEEPFTGLLPLAHQNILGIGGGLNLLQGGCISFQGRNDSIVQNIQHSAIVISLNEVYDTAYSEALIQKYKDQYGYVFSHLGPNLWGSESGVMMFSKVAPSYFKSVSFANNDWSLNRVFGVLEIGEGEHACRIIGTHLSHGDNAERRREQFLQIVAFIATRPYMPTFIMGDLNMEYKSEKAFLGEYLDLEKGYDYAEPTCTDELKVRWKTGAVITDPKKLQERIDYMVPFKPEHWGFGEVRNKTVQLENPVELIPAFKRHADGTINSNTANSDHHGLRGSYRISIN